jgi:hypothetical protein
VIVGDRFGMLTVLVLFRTRAGYPMALAKCDCGATHRVRTTDLRRGHTKSCGHLLRVGHKHSSAVREQLSRAARARVARAARERKKMEEVRHAAV